MINSNLYFLPPISKKYGKPHSISDLSFNDLISDSISVVINEIQFQPNESKYASDYCNLLFSIKINFKFQFEIGDDNTSELKC